MNGIVQEPAERMQTPCALHHQVQTAVYKDMSGSFLKDCRRNLESFVLWEKRREGT